MQQLIICFCFSQKVYIFDAKHECLSALTALLPTGFSMNTVFSESSLFGIVSPQKVLKNYCHSFHKLKNKLLKGGCQNEIIKV